MRGPGRADIVNAVRRAYIVNAGSGESVYSECGVRGRADIVNAGPGRAGIVNAGSGESGYSECGVRGERI
ncbi:unnamed protein product [Staurois parvus]|uniref:Uncharacterized protein n=1 Tax=Staurois parvus TaxID=386267 RepID=A0ABN9FZX7_9NEOB|nr:unnamed protein product [Staurois parvus]